MVPPRWELMPEEQGPGEQGVREPEAQEGLVTALPSPLQAQEYWGPQLAGEHEQPQVTQQEELHCPGAEQCRGRSPSA